MATPAIAVKNLTKKYGDVVAIDDQSIEIEPGEFLVLLGPSGCGKTTLLRCLAGLEKPDAGEIAIGGEVVFSSTARIDRKPGERRVGMVFQSYALWPHMTVNENIAFGLRVKGTQKNEVRERVSAVLEDLGLGGLGERYPFELSGGQQQRVALARMLVSDTNVFLMDEPLSNLDARLRLDTRAEIKRLHHERRATTVYVTHDQVEAMTMATRIVVMNSGRIQQVGTPDDVYQRPANVTVADFVGLPRINLLPGEVHSGASGRVLSCPVGSRALRNGSLSTRVVVGLRPEDIRLVGADQDGPRVGVIHAVQPAGPEQLIHVRCGDHLVLARDTENRRFSVDETVGIEVNWASVNVFDAATGDLVEDMSFS